MSKAVQHVAHFSVEGKGLTGIVRNLYCFEENREGAISILTCLDGITVEQMIKICTGDAYLNDMTADGTMQYVEKPDPEFKHEYHTFMINKEHRARKIKEAEEAAYEELKAAAEKNHLGPDEMQWVRDRNPYSEDNLARERLSARGREIYDAGIPISLKDGTVLQKGEPTATDALDIAMRQADIALNGIQLPPPSTETIRIGRWDVPKNYLDRYAGHVVKRIRGLIRMQTSGICSISAIDPIATYELEIERQTLHNAICEAIGVPHSDIGQDRTQDQVDFDDALEKYLDKHAGSLFNGGE